MIVFLKLSQFSADNSWDKYTQILYIWAHTDLGHWPIGSFSIIDSSRTGCSYNNNKNSDRTRGMTGIDSSTKSPNRMLVFLLSKNILSE